MSLLGAVTASETWATLPNGDEVVNRYGGIVRAGGQAASGGGSGHGLGHCQANFSRFGQNQGKPHVELRVGGRDVPWDGPRFPDSHVLLLPTEALPVLMEV